MIYLGVWGYFPTGKFSLLNNFDWNRLNKHADYEPLHDHQSAAVAILLKGACHAKGSYGIKYNSMHSFSLKLNFK